MPALPAETPPLTPADRALLLALTDPVRRPSETESADALSHAHFLSRPDIQPRLEALQRFRAFRAEIERDHRADLAIDALLEVASTTTDLVEKRLAATAVIRLLFPPRLGARRASEGHRARSASEGHASSPAPRERVGRPPGADEASAGPEDPAAGPTHNPVSTAPPAPLSPPSTPSTSSTSSTSSMASMASTPAAPHTNPVRHADRRLDPTPAASLPSAPQRSPSSFSPHPSSFRSRSSRTQALARAAGAAPFDST